MCLLDLFQGMEGGWGAVEIAWVFLGGFLLGSSNTKKQGDHWNKKFFINKSVKALISLKEGHQGLLKLYVPLRGCSCVGGNGAPKRGFCLKWKNSVRGGLPGPIEILCIFWRGLGVFWWKKWGGNRRKRFYSEMWGKPVWGVGLWKSRGTLHMRWSYRNFWIHLVNIWWMLDCILSQNCRNTLPLHTVDQLGSSAESERLLWLAGMKCVKIWIYCATVN